MSRPVQRLLLAAALITSACTHQVMPKITPEKVPSVDPPIASRAVLLLGTSFEQYGAEQSDGIHKYHYHYGEAMTKALSDLISQSFAHADVRHVEDAEVLRWLTAAPDTAVADVLLVPYFEKAAPRERVLDVAADARLRLEARTLAANQTYSWIATGHSARVFSSRRGLTGSTLEQVLRALSDSLGAHRAELEASTGTQ